MSALATGDVALEDWRKLIQRELMIAAALGATMAMLVSPIGWMRGGFDIAFVVGITMVLVVIIGSLVGMSLPFLLSRFQLDPATASALTANNQAKLTVIDVCRATRGRGSARKELPVRAKQLKVDLIDMGTVARTDVAGFLMGNTAETILNQINCSVLAIEPPGFETPVLVKD